MNTIIYYLVISLLCYVFTEATSNHLMLCYESILIVYHHLTTVHVYVQLLNIWKKLKILKNDFDLNFKDNQDIDTDKLDDFIKTLNNYIYIEFLPIFNKYYRNTHNTVNDKLIYGLLQLLFENYVKYFYSQQQHLLILKEKIDMKYLLIETIDWLELFNTQVCNFILKDCFFSFNTILVDYNEKFDYFKKNYQALEINKIESFIHYQLSLQQQEEINIDLMDLYIQFQSLQSRSRKLLLFGDMILFQREEITNFVNKYNFLKSLSVQDINIIEHFYCDLMARYNWISYPQIDLEGLETLVHNYNCSLYLDLSDIKLDIINIYEQIACQ